MSQNSFWLNNENNGGFMTCFFNGGITKNMAELLAELHKFSFVVSRGVGKSLVYTSLPSHETGKNLTKKEDAK